MTNDPTPEQLESANDDITLANALIEKAEDLAEIIRTHTESGNVTMPLNKLTEILVLVSELALVNAITTGSMLQENALRVLE